MRKQSTARYIVTLILSYCLSFFLIVFITGVIALRTVFNPWYILTQADRSGFPEQAASELREIFISYGHASGVSSEFMASLITARHVADAVEGSILITFEEGTVFSYTKYTDDIFHKLQDYAQSQGYETTSAVRIGLNDLAVLCTNALKDYLGSPIIGFLAAAQRNTQNLFVGILIVGVLSLIAIFALPFTNRRVTRWIDGYIYALGAAVILCAAVPVAAYVSNITSRLQITPVSFNKLISSLLDGVIYGYLIALIPLILFMIICIIIRILRSAKRRDQRRYIL